MKQLNLILFKLVSFLIFNSMNADYTQQGKIFVYSKNLNITNTLNNILTKFNLKYENIQGLYNDDESLYIIAGDLNTLTQSTIPKYYIVYQTNDLHELSAPIFELLSNAISVWDSSLENINKYKNRIHNFYYLPNENYEFLDPIILPCFLPVKALSAYKNMLQYSNTNSSDISMHIPSLFCHCVFQKPEIIVEAGVRWGNGSTVPLYAARELLNAFMIGIDINNCSHIYSSFIKSFFLQINDLEFPHYLKQMNFQQNKIDFAFIDTTHVHDHSLKEMEMFTSLLSENGALGFHDSNPIPGDPDGVKIALKEYFNITFDESKYGNYIVEKDHYIWNIIHYPYCNGMTIAKRLKKLVL